MENQMQNKFRLLTILTEDFINKWQCFSQHYSVELYRQNYLWTINITYLLTYVRS
jgi:hypothetical protein